ncbi:type VI secretion system contractile sheath protein TssC [candidate division KSB1 bacterium]|nr:type VI secretion system contractile sheath protein TssC [candidate division KSB1 bacterium]
MAKEKRDELQPSDVLEGTSPKTREKSAVAELDSQIEKLATFGRFDVIKTSIRSYPGQGGEKRAGVENLDPKNPARRNIFLSDKLYADARPELKKRLKMLIDTLKEGGDVDSLIKSVGERSEKLAELTNKNIKSVLDTAKDLEVNYRAAAAFFSNAERSKGAPVENLSFINASLEQLKDIEIGTFLNSIGDEFEESYNNLDLRNNYSMLVVPGYLGDKQTVNAFAEACSRRKVMLITDYRDVDSYETLMSLYKDEDIAGTDLFNAYTIMACNWLVGRGRYDELDETEDLYMPPSAALAGKIYSNPIQQTSAGKRDGRLKEVRGVRFPLKLTEVGYIGELGIIPMLSAFGNVQAFNDKSLFVGDNKGLQTYSVLRTFDYVKKALKHFLGQYNFRNISSDMISDIRSQILNFLEQNKGADKLLEDFKIIDVKRHPTQQDRVIVNVNITPYYAVRLFEINLTGMQGKIEENEQAQ